MQYRLMSCDLLLMQLDPTSERALVGKAAVLIKLGEPQQALCYCDLALEQRPGYHKALKYRADALSILGEPEQALMLLDTAIAGLRVPDGAILLRFVSSCVFMQMVATVVTPCWESGGGGGGGGGLLVTKTT